MSMQFVDKFAEELFRRGYRSFTSKGIKTPQGVDLGKTEFEAEVSLLMGSVKNPSYVNEYHNNKKTIIPKVIASIRNLSLKEKEQIKEKREETFLYTRRDSFDFSDCALGMDILEDDKMFVFVRGTGQVTPESPKQFLATLRKEDQEEVRVNAVFGLLEYDPKNPQKSTRTFHRGRPIVKFNSYMEPEWKYHKTDKPPHPFFLKLMNHLFPFEDTRKYVFQWMKNMMLDRNETILVLIGSNGIGKNILVGDVMSQLVGPHNRIHFGETFFQSRFSDEVTCKKLVVFDETIISTGHYKKERLKEMCNSTLSVEPKNKSRRVVPNYASFVIINNYDDQNYLVARDRRFSIPEITNKRLIPEDDDGTIYEEVNKFVSDLKNPEVVAAIANYILKTDMSDFQSHQAWKKEKFWNVMYLSLTEWQKAVVNEIFTKSKTEYVWMDILMDLKDNGVVLKRVPGEVTINKFLTEEFVDKEGDSLGFVVRRNNVIKIIPSKKYLPEGTLAEVGVQESPEELEDEIFNLDDGQMDEELEDFLN